MAAARGREFTPNGSTMPVGQRMQELFYDRQKKARWGNGQVLLSNG
jgi:hypothetical protein